LLSSMLDDDTFLADVSCTTWQELVDIAGGPLVRLGYVEPLFLQSIKDTVVQYGSYMVIVDDVALFHGRPEAGVHKIALSLALLREPVFLGDKRIKAAFVFAAIDHDSHIDLLKELAQCLADEQLLSLVRNHGTRRQIRHRMQIIEEENRG